MAVSFISISLPEHMQLQSPLCRLPGEIRNMIYEHCFTSDHPLIDPATSRLKGSETEARVLGISLLQTCRLIYHEADRRPLFAGNTFQFTSVDRVRLFLNCLKPENAALIQDIEIDVRKVHSDHPGIAREWLHYLAWGSGSWAKTLGSLRMEAPGLKVLRLNFEAWPALPMFRAELWDLLRTMLLRVRGLDRIVVIGAKKEASRYRGEPWSPMYFVGGEDVGSDDLIQHMWPTVSQPEDQNKIIRWRRSERRVFLEVVTWTYLSKHREQKRPLLEMKAPGPWPENGSCTWYAYQYRNDEAVPEQRLLKLVSPISA